MSGRKLLNAAGLVLLFGMPAAAQDPPAAPAPAPPPAPAAAELTQLLQDFLAGAGSNDAAMHERFWADDLIYTGSSGRRLGKADVVRVMKAAPPPQPGDPKLTYEAEEIRIQQYGDAAVVAFRLIARTEKDGKSEVTRYLNTGTFVRREGRWQAVAWQATKAPEEAAPNR